MDIELHTGDELGPFKVLVVRDPSVDLLGFVVVDNIAAGPAIGGIRMAPDVTITEVARLARAMTLKNASAGLAHGGAKGGIVGDPRRPIAEKEAIIRAFARGIATLVEYIPGPDMGTDEGCMAWIRDEGGRAAGLPKVVGGIPLDEIGATGLGIAVAAEVTAEHAGITLEGARVAVQGFGAVGKFAARFLAERGARLVAATDSRGGRHDPEGLPIEDLIALKAEGRSVAECPSGQAITHDDLIGIECEIWIPAARPDVLTASNVGRLQAKLVLQGANIPATPEAEADLHARGIINVPDFIANAGGVICAAVEFHGGDEARAREAIVTKIRENTAEVLRRSRERGILPRAAALELAHERVREAMRYHRA
ncbi:MAG: Glu/Leu/Phe/Val dehydrogenase [Myxococcales bacterium]|nr:Glu/Leu/Phe/Val dehydrogenase [Myxococcales bacterium]